MDLDQVVSSQPDTLHRRLAAPLRKQQERVILAPDEAPEFPLSGDELKEFYSNLFNENGQRAHSLQYVFPDLKPSAESFVTSVTKRLDQIVRWGPLMLRYFHLSEKRAGTNEKPLLKLLGSERINELLPTIIGQGSGPEADKELSLMHALWEKGYVLTPEQVPEVLDSLEVSDEFKEKYWERFENSGVRTQAAVDGLVLRAHLCSRTKAAIEALGGEFGEAVIQSCESRSAYLCEALNFTPDGEVLEECLALGDKELVERLHEPLRFTLGSIASVESQEGDFAKVRQRGGEFLQLVGALEGDFPYDKVNSGDAEIIREPEVLQAVVDSLLVAKDYSNLRTLRKVLSPAGEGVDLVELPASPEVVNKFLAPLLEDELLGDCDKTGSTAMLALFLACTGIEPDLSSDKLSEIRKNYLASQANEPESSYEGLESFLGLTEFGCSYDRSAFGFCAFPGDQLETLPVIDLLGEDQPSIPPEVLQHAVDTHLPRLGPDLSVDSFIFHVENLTSNCAVKPELKPELLIEAAKSLTSSRERYPTNWGVHSADLTGFLTWVELFTGEKPPQECIEAIRVALYHHRFILDKLEDSDTWFRMEENYEKSEGELRERFDIADLPLSQEKKYQEGRRYYGEVGPLIREWMCDRYGPLSEEAAQRLYYERIQKETVAANLALVDTITAETEGLTGGPFLPDMDSLRKLALEDGHEDPDKFLQERFNKMCNKSLESPMGAGLDVIRKLEGSLGVKPKFEPKDETESFLDSEASDLESICRIENLFGMRHELSELEAQLIYIDAIPLGFGFQVSDDADEGIDPEEYRKGEWEKIQALVDYLHARSGVTPFKELAQDRYLRLTFGPHTTVEDFGRLRNILGVEPATAIQTDAVFAIGMQYMVEPEDSNLNRLRAAIEAIDANTELSEEQLQKIFDFCASKKRKQHHKFGNFVDELDISLDQDFVQKNLLDNKSFFGAVKYPISDQILAEHFAKPENQTIQEHVRIYSIFRCFDYFKRVVTDKVANGDVDDLERDVAIYTAIAVNEQERDLYLLGRNGLQSLHGLEQQRLIKPLAEAFHRLVDAGEYYLPREFGKVLRRHMAKGCEDDGKPARLGYQESVALRTLGQVSYWEGNKALLSMVFAENVSRHLKRHILKHLASKDGIFPSYTRETVLSALGGEQAGASGKNLHERLRDFDFLRAIRNMPSVGLAHAASQVFDAGYKELHKQGLSGHELHERHASSIPREVFMQVGVLVDWDTQLIEKFNEVYRITPSKSKRDRLLVGITNCCFAGDLRLKELQEIFRENELDSHEQVEKLTSVLRTVGFLQKLDRHIDYKRYYDKDVSRSLNWRRLLNVDEDLKIHQAKHITRAIENQVSLFDVRKLCEAWEDMDPLLGAATGLRVSYQPHGEKALSEVIAHCASGDEAEWKQYRYHEDRKRVRAQLEHLTPEQRCIWEENYFDEIPDLSQSVTKSDPAHAVFTLLREGVLSRAKGGQSGVKVSDKALDRFQVLLAEVSLESNEGEREKYFKQEIESLDDTLTPLKASARVEYLEKLLGILGSIQGEPTLAVNTRTKQCFAALSSFMSDHTDSESLLIRYRFVTRGLQEVQRQEVITDAEIDQLTEWIVSEHEVVSQDLESSQDAEFETGDSYSIRELSLYRGLCNLAASSSTDFAATGNGSREIVRNFKRVAREFKGTELEETLGEIKDVISPSVDRRAILFTDDPFLILQIGKYPINAASCMNYESSPDRVSLLPSYMADGHIKALIMVDLKRLPRELQHEIDEFGFESVKDKITRPQILQACIYRRMVRSVEAEKYGAGNFVEPVYPRLYGEGMDVEQQFVRFMDERISGPMEVPTLRQGEELEVRVPDSRFDTGQLEDRMTSNGRRYPLERMKGSYQMRAEVVRAGELLGENGEEQIVAPHLAVASERDEFEPDEFSSVFIDEETAKRGYRIVKRFDLNTAQFFSGDTIERIRAAEDNPDVHMVRVHRPSFQQVYTLSKEGYIYVPDKVGYRLELPAGGEGSDPLEQYYASFRRGSQRRREIRKLEEKIESGELEFVWENGEQRENVTSFLDLYTREMANKDRGHTPLLDQIQQEGKGPEGFLGKKRIGAFLKHEGEVIAGIIARNHKDSYSISYSAIDSDLRNHYRQMQLYLITQLIQRSVEEGRGQMDYGVDTNLYGHHLGVGLAQAKLGQGFTPYPMQNSASLIKINDLSVFDLPVFFYSYGARNELEGNVILTPDQDVPTRLNGRRKLNTQVVETADGALG